MTSDRKTAVYRFCNYQERSQKEVKDYLYEIGSYTAEVDNLLAELIQTGLLNEERFAKAYVRGKYRLKLWGRIKIKHELSKHKISDYILKKAFAEIELNEYFGNARKLATQKWVSLEKEKNVFIRRKKTFSYLLQKGYESSLITELINDIAQEKDVR